METKNRDVAVVDRVTTSLQLPLGLITTPPAPIMLRPEQAVAVQQQMQSLDFATLPHAEIAKLGMEASKNLQAMLDDFLQTIGHDRTEVLSRLCDRLSQGVADADLPQLQQEILSKRELGWFERFFLSKKNIAEAARAAYENTVTQVTETTSNLTAIMGGMESELHTEICTLGRGLSELEELKRGYHSHLDEFAIVVGVCQSFRAQAREQLAVMRESLKENPDPIRQADFQDLEHKLELLESRTLALEGVYTRLPADQLVIQQIQGAAVATVQEVITTASERFSSIKVALLALRGLLDVRGVQMVADKQRDMDRQLNKIRGDIMREVVNTAANAPGDNRLAQAEKIMEIISDTQAIHNIVSTARAKNQAKFSQAETMFGEARQQLAELHQGKYLTQDDKKEDT